MKKKMLSASEIVSLSGDALASVTGGCSDVSCMINCTVVFPERGCGSSAASATKPTPAGGQP